MKWGVGKRGDGVICRCGMDVREVSFFGFLVRVVGSRGVRGSFGRLYGGALFVFDRWFL